MGAARIQLVNRALFAALLEQARQSPRRRINFNFHAGPEDNPHRFLNVMLEGAYIAPHRHSDPPKAESFLVLEGEVAFFIFDGRGRIAEIRRLGGDPMGIDLPPGVWHTMAVLSPHAVCYEVKPGPYSPLTDKEFAPWAPREGDPAVPAYLRTLLASLEEKGADRAPAPKE
jgi:cupin fold WbuC family metalloprotein